MLLGPIFSVELVTTARRVRYFVIRVVYAAILLVILWGTYQSVAEWSSELGIRQSATLASLFFSWFAFLQLAVVLLIGPALAAGTIATERERRTIEYLFVTHLSNREIVVDKLAARLLLIFYVGLVGMPVIWIFRLLGGISSGLLLVSFLMTASTMIAVAAMSVCLSVWSRRARDAVMRAYLVLIAILIMPLLLLSLLAWPGGVGAGRFTEVLSRFTDFCLIINPLWVMGAALGWGGGVAGAAIDWTNVQRMVLSHLGIAALCTVSATLAVRRVHTRSMGGTSRGRWEIRLPRWRLAIGRYPMLWKELFVGGSTQLGFAGRIALAVVVLGVLASTGAAITTSYASASPPGYPPVRAYATYAAIMGAAVSCGIVLLLAARAAMSVACEKERQSWDAVLASPLSSRQIVTGKIAGSLYAVRWLFALLFAIWLPAVLMMWDFVFALPLVFGTLFILAWYASALGVLLSISCRTSIRAMAATLVVGIFVGGGYLFTCCMPVLMLGSSSSVQLIFAPCIPFLLGMPGLFYTEVRFGSAMSQEWELITTYLLGIIAYAAAAVLLTVAAIVNFDQLTGRTQLDWYRLSHPRPPKINPVEDHAG